MTRLRPVLLAALTVVFPVPGLIVAGASWRLVAMFAALWFLFCAMIAFVPTSSMTMHMAFFAAPLLLGVAASPLALRAARRMNEVPKPWFRRWYAFPLWVLLAVGLTPSTWLFPSFYFDASGHAMEPTLRNGERLLANKLHNPATTDLRQGEVVIFWRGDTLWVRRLIGLPGDRVQMRGGRLIINQQEVQRELVGSQRLESRGITARVFRETLPGGAGRAGASYLILDENDGGPLDNTAEFVVPDGHVFVMSDTRDLTLDSRVMTVVGYIPLRRIVGRARYIVWPLRGGRIGTQLD